MKSLKKATGFFRKRSASFYWLMTSMSASVLILFGSLNYLYRQTIHIYDDFNWVEHTYQVINELDEVKKGISECEASARGYAITHQNDLIEAYVRRKNYIYDQLDHLYQLTADNPRQHQRVGRLRDLTRERFLLLDSTVQVARQIAATTTVSPFPETLTNKVTQGYQLTKVIGFAQEQLKAEENRLLDIRKQRSQNTLDRSAYFIIVTVLVGIIITILIGVVIHNYIGKQKQIALQLEHLNEQKKRFFSIISHDLRGPIHSSITLLHLYEELGNSISEVEKKELYDAALRSMQQTANLLENLLTWGRAQLDRLVFEPRHVQAHLIADRVLKLLEPIALEKEIQLINDVAPESLVYADAVMLELVIRNLVSNSLKFTLPQGQVRIHANETATQSEIAITDTGIGMSQEVIDRLFRIDSKFTLPGTKGEKGTGLGLVLCQQYIEKHGGAIHISSRLGKGSTFRICLPQVKLAVTQSATVPDQEAVVYA